MWGYDTLFPKPLLVSDLLYPNIECVIISHSFHFLFTPHHTLTLPTFTLFNSPFSRKRWGVLGVVSMMRQGLLDSLRFWRSHLTPMRRATPLRQRHPNLPHLPQPSAMQTYVLPSFSASLQRLHRRLCRRLRNPRPPLPGLCVGKV